MTGPSHDEIARVVHRHCRVLLVTTDVGINLELTPQGVSRRIVALAIHAVAGAVLIVAGPSHDKIARCRPSPPSTTAGYY